MRNINSRNSKFPLLPLSYMLLGWEVKGQKLMMGIKGYASFSIKV